MKYLKLVLNYLTTVCGGRKQGFKCVRIEQTRL